MYFCYFVIIFPWKGQCPPVIWRNLNPLHPGILCAKFGWNCPSSSGEEDEHVKSLQTDGRTDRHTDDGWQVIRKAHLSFQFRWAKKAEARTQSHVRNPINMTLRSKVNVVSGSWMYLTHPVMVIDPCAKYGMPMSKQTEITGRTWRHDKSLLIWPWGQSSILNQEHECTCRIFSWW